MKLVELRIEDYKSIKKLEWKLDQDINCLVGQNESGKSNLLEALDFLTLKKINELSFEKHTNRSSERYLETEIPLIEAVFRFDDVLNRALVEKLKSFFSSPEALEEFKFLRRFVIRTVQKNNDSGHFYFEDEEHYFTFEYLFGNDANNSKVLNAIEGLRTKVIRLEEDYIDSFELTIDEVTKESNPDAALIKLLKLGGVKDTGRIPKEHKSLNRYLKRLSSKLNTAFTKKYYSQDSSVNLNIVHNSNRLYLEIEDDTEAEYAIHERSEGFRYFFGLLIEIASMDNDSDIILVLDEPGGKLHPSGQRDLLRYMEELSTRPEYRVIYTTHSPFLVNRLFPNRVRIVERDKRKGTVFKLKGFSKNWHPMRSALGLTISDSFYYSEKALIVEGPEDIIYLSSLINLFSKNDEVIINSDIFSFIDSGGEGNLPSMVQIMIDDERPIMVLIDSDSPRTFNKLDKKRRSLKSGMLILNQINDFRTMAISIEDLLPKEILRIATNNFLRELIEDESLKPIKGKEVELLEIVEDNSIYKKEIVDFVKDNFQNPSKENDEWEKEKTPISKVGIARNFEKIIHDESFDFQNWKSEFKYSMKLVKTVVDKLKLKE